jgi:hypothetical protein
MPFRRLLTTLVSRTKGARGAIFCDYEGEFVDLAIGDPLLSDYELKVFGAQLAATWITVDANAKTRGAGGIVELRLSCAAGTLLCNALPDGYYVVLVLERNHPSASAAFELSKTTVDLAAELLR